MIRTADTIEEAKAAQERSLVDDDAAIKAVAAAKKRRGPGNPDKIKPFQFKKGQSGNPSGRPKHDVAADIARAIFENNPRAIYQAFAKGILKANAYTFKELAERAYGKLKETHEVHSYQEVVDADLNKRIADLERELGLAAAIDEAGRAGLAAAGTEKANGKAQDTPVLS